jgi:hypothetical protein
MSGARGLELRVTHPRVELRRIGHVHRVELPGRHARLDLEDLLRLRRRGLPGDAREHEGLGDVRPQPLAHGRHRVLEVDLFRGHRERRLADEDHVPRPVRRIGGHPGADQHGIVQPDPEPCERRGEGLRAVDRIDARELPGERRDSLRDDPVHVEPGSVLIADLLSGAPARGRPARARGLVQDLENLLLRAARHLIDGEMRTVSPGIRAASIQRPEA